MQTKMSSRVAINGAHKKAHYRMTIDGTYGVTGRVPLHR